MARCKVAVAFLLAIGLTVASEPAVAAPCWRPPVAGEVVDPFRAPPCRWCPGNRGIEYRVGQSANVRAVASGVVTFSGIVAGTRYVVIRLSTGWRITYGDLERTALRRGDRVVAGVAVGTASGRFHLGLRVDDRYVDPAPFLGHVVGRPRLIPHDGRAPRAAPPPRVRCG